MIQDPFWVISFFLSSLIAFFSCSLVVQGILIFFKVKNARVRSLLKIFPVLYPLIDLFLKTFSIGRFLNPLDCDSCFQKLLLSLTPELKIHLSLYQISLTSYLASTFSATFFILISMIFALVTALVFLRKLVQVVSCLRSLNRIFNRTVPSTRPIENRVLQEALERHNISIDLSDAIYVPMAVYRKTILIPTLLSQQLGQNEFEAVLSHELEHLRWKDPAVKLFSELIATFFWWIPMKSWLKDLDEDREISCDKSIHLYGIDKEALASTLIKVVSNQRHQTSRKTAALCKLSGTSSSLLLRLQTLLNPSQIQHKNLFWHCCLSTFIASITLLVCMMI